MATRENYQLLIQKLDQFIRKYYVNKLIRGSLYSLGLVLLLFLAASLLEYFFYFGSGMRRLIFFSFIITSLLAIGGWVVMPLLQYFRLGRVISHEQAAAIIGEHFGNVKDKLLNILQLNRQAESVEDKSLILASINQKSEEIRPVPFQSAIDLGKNRRYLRYALPPLLILLMLLFAAPSLIWDSTDRLINNGREYERPAPFRFVVAEDELSVVQFNDFPLTVNIEGDQLPNEVFIEIGGSQYRLSKEAANRFTYRFNNVQEALDFQLFSSGIESREYTLAVLKKPNIAGFEVRLNYPDYTGRRDESLSNIGDLTVPAGTTIDWMFNALHTEGIELAFANQPKPELARRSGDEFFTFQRRALRNESYMLYVSNADLPRADSVSYSLTVIPDLYPEIGVERFQDSTQLKMLYFAGEASDDYGLRSLTFNYRVKKGRDGQPGELQTIPLARPEGKQVRYDHVFDLNEIDLQPGDEVTYYFEVYDNDVVNGNKAARTGLMTFAVPTKEELAARAEQNDQKIKDDLQKSLEESRKIQNEMKQLREKLLQQKEMDWQTRKELEKLLNRQKELEKQIEKAKESFEENLRNEEEFNETDERLQEKQEKLQQLFDEVMSEEMKELMKQIEELMQQLEKDNALEMMEDFQFNDEEMEMELDRLMELFKQLELEQELTETIEQLEELAEEQEKLSEETEKQNNQENEQNQNKSQEELQQEQQEINEKFDAVQEKMEEIEQKNEELEQPKEMENFDQQMENIDQDLQKSQQQLQQQKNKNASQSQKNAAQKMRNMASMMQQQMQQQEMEQMQEDMASLRQLLENLVGLSFDQEALIDQFQETEINTPRYVELVQQQFKLQDDFGLIEDSLQALSKRVFQIESFITEKVADIKGNMRESLNELEERRKPQAADPQQRTMKNVNDLALMLSEVMNQMQQQMSSMMAGSQMCTKPGGQGSQGNAPKDKMSQGQQQLNDQMRQMKDKMGKGGQRGTSQEFAQMAARQAALRKALQEKQREMQQRGKGSKELQELIEQMDKAEEDLVNKRLTNEMMKRQEDILGRLLEHENAERERDLDDRRKSESAEQRERPLPPSVQEYLRKREAEIELFKTVSPALKPYYKSLVEDYLQRLRQ